MASYISTLKLMDNTIAPESSDESVFADYAEGASRLFDLLCDVPENFFDKTNNTPAPKTFDGNGIDILRLPPFVADSVTAILLDGVAFAADKYKLKNGFLFYKKGCFDSDSVITVTAKWGFAEIPAEVKIVVQELANYLYRNRDPLFAKISDVEVEKELSPTTNAIIKKFRDKYSTSAY